MRLFKIFLLSLGVFVAPLFPLQAYEANTPFWSRIRLHSTFFVKQDTYKVRISGMHPSDKEGVLQLNSLVEEPDEVRLYLIRWYHAPSIHFNRDKQSKYSNTSTIDDTRILYFTGNGISLCAQFFLSMDLRQLRLGAGSGIKCSFFKQMVGRLVPSTQLSKTISSKNVENKFLNYIPKKTYYFTFTPLVLVGYKIGGNRNYSLWLDSTWSPQLFSFSEFDIKYYWEYWFNFDCGTTWERQISRYVNWSLRLAYSFYSNNERLISDSSPKKLPVVVQRIRGVLLQVGMSIRIPTLRRCPILGCATRLDHKHNGKIYRGDSFFIPHPDYAYLKPNYARSE